MSSDLDEFRNALTNHLDWFADQGRKVQFWWRDDDAFEPTPQLDRMVDLANQHEVEIGLAVIPKNAGAPLRDRLEDECHVQVLQHGWHHKNYQRKDLGERAAELGTRRDMNELRQQLSDGRAKLDDLFGEKFIPAMVPPWNRIAPEVAQMLPEIGLPGLSTFTWLTEPRAHQLQTHIDIIKWKNEVRYIGWDKARLRFEEELLRRRDPGGEPLGILTHHLVHDDGCWSFLKEFLAIAAHHPGAEWPSIKSLFDCPQKLAK